MDDSLAANDRWRSLQPVGFAPLNSRLNTDDALRATPPPSPRGQHHLLLRAGNTTSFPARATPPPSPRGQPSGSPYSYATHFQASTMSP